jgi:hypothetical protein
MPAMSDPTIRAALEAACSDVFDRLRDVWPDEAGPPPDVMPMTAAAVAAFLRALRHGATIHYADDPSQPVWAWDAFIGCDLATAVERAAREGE